MAPGSGARGSRATDFGSPQPVIRWEPTDCGTRIGGPRISGYEFGFCTSTPSLGLPGVGPTPSGPRDLGQRIWDLHNHSFDGGPRIGARGWGAHGYRATDLGSARPLKNRGPSCWHPRIGGPRISGYGFGICTTTHSFGTHGLWPADWGPTDLALRIRDLLVCARIQIRNPRSVGPQSVGPPTRAPTNARVYRSQIRSSKSMGPKSVCPHRIEWVCSIQIRSPRSVRHQSAGPPRMSGCPNPQGLNPKGPNAKVPNAKSPNAKGPKPKGPNPKRPIPNGPNAKSPNPKQPNPKHPNPKGPNPNGPNAKDPNAKGPNPKGRNRKGPNAKGPSQGVQMQGVQMQMLLIQIVRIQRVQMQRVQMQSVQMQSVQMQTVQSQRVQRVQMQRAQMQSVQMQSVQMQRVQMQMVQIQKGQSPLGI